MHGLSSLIIRVIKGYGGSVCVRARVPAHVCACVLELLILVDNQTGGAKVLRGTTKLKQVQTKHKQTRAQCGEDEHTHLATQDVRERQRERARWKL